MDSIRPGLTDEINDAITTRMNQLGHQAALQPLTWLLFAGRPIRVSGCAGVTCYDVEAVLEAWAGWLGLTGQNPPSCPGTVEYRGRVDGLDVELWAVTDRGLFAQATQRNAQPR